MPFIASKEAGVACCANCSYGATNKGDYTTYCTLKLRAHDSEWCCDAWELREVVRG